MSDCIFCKIIKGEIPSVKIYEDDRVYAFADINPVTDGHTLVIPKTHAQGLLDISAEDLAAVARGARKVAAAIEKALNPTGIIALQLNGASVGQMVMHYHMHLVPRVEGGPELTMGHWKMVPGDMDTIKAVGARIAAALG
jgi:histidine triad (HIT) family protein